jgi:hypothetical protein
VTGDLDLQGPTVTLFGDRDALDSALSDELARRGRSTHSVTTPVGWLLSTTQAVVRLDTPSGDFAMRDLLTRDVEPTHVVAVCEESSDDTTASRIDELCRQGAARHEISLIWHAAFKPTTLGAPAEPSAAPAPSPGRLATAIAEEIARQQEHASNPSFVSQVFDAQP